MLPVFDTRSKMVATTIDDFIKVFPHWGLSSETTEYFKRLHEKLRSGLQKVQGFANETHLGAKVAFEHKGNVLATGGHLGGKSLTESLPKALAHALANLYITVNISVNHRGLGSELDYSIAELEAFTDSYFKLSDTVMFKLMGGMLLEGKKTAGIKVIATVPDEYAGEVNAKPHPLFFSKVVVSKPYLFERGDMYPEAPDAIVRKMLGHIDKKKIGGAYIMPIVSRPITYN